MVHDAHTAAFEDHAPDGMPSSAPDRRHLVDALAGLGFTPVADEDFPSLCPWCGPFDVTPHRWTAFGRAEARGRRRVLYGSCARCRSPYTYEADDDTLTPWASEESP